MCDDSETLSENLNAKINYSKKMGKPRSSTATHFQE